MTGPIVPVILSALLVGGSAAWILPGWKYVQSDRRNGLRALERTTRRAAARIAKGGE